MEVLPTPHFCCGGIKIGVHGDTTLPGLFAAGEAAGGIHGANRLGANSFPDLQVFGVRAGQSAGAYALKNRNRPNLEQVNRWVEALSEPLGRPEGVSPISIRKKIQKMMYQNVGIMRIGERLRESKKLLEEIHEKEIPKMKISSNPIFNYEWVESIKVRNMLRAALVVTSCALFREESRGVHYREDFPERDKTWLVNVNAMRENGGIKIFKTPLVINKSYEMSPKNDRD
jgi:succinate dehydrogenase/fumarate reductase flavoprotein subunit